jgi:hypothetical protein
MKLGSMMGLAVVALLASAGLAAAAEGCACCKDMAANAPMTCCDKMEPSAPTPAPVPTPTPDA